MVKWDWLEERIKECGYKSRRQFAIAIDWNDARISDMVNNRPTANNKIPSFPKDKLTQVSELLKIDLKSLIQYNNDEIDTVVFLENSLPAVNQIKVPYFNVCAAAGDGYFNDNEYITSFITLTSGKFEAPIKRLKNPAIIIIKGSSMEPTFKEGNMILVDAGNKDFIEGKVYVIRIGDNLCIKRLFKNPLNNKIICKPDNPLHPTLELNKDEFEIKAIFVLKIFEEIV